MGCRRAELGTEGGLKQAGGVLALHDGLWVLKTR
jgi:hypothetical protein